MYVTVERGELQAVLVQLNSPLYSAALMYGSARSRTKESLLEKLRNQDGGSGKVDATRRGFGRTRSYKRGANKMAQSATANGYQRKWWK